MGKLPLDKKLFLKVFGAVIALLVVTAIIVKIWIPGEWTRTNLVGSLISSVLFSYLVHLWLLPSEDPPPENQE